MIDWTELRVDFENGVMVGGEIVFSHVDDVTGEVRHFAVERIAKDIEKMAVPPPIIEVPIDQTFAQFCIRARGVEPHRWNRITPQDVCHYPILMAVMPGVGRDTKDSHLIIDGIHRYTRAAAWGWPSVRGYELQPEFWQQYLVRVPDEVNRQQAVELEAQKYGHKIDSRIR